MNKIYFFGAGSTAPLGMPQTAEQERIYTKMLGLSSEPCENYDKLINTMQEKLLNSVELKNDFINLKLLAKSFFVDKFELQRFFNTIDMMILLKQNINVKENDSHDVKVLSVEDLVRIREVYIIILLEVFKYSSNKCMDKNFEQITQLKEFYKKLARKQLQMKLNSINEKTDKTSREFYLADYAVVNCNWDIWSIMPMFIAHQELNDENARYRTCDTVNTKLKMFNDFCIPLACSRKDYGGKVWYPYDEATATRVNDRDYHCTRNVVLVKTFFPHGLTNLLKCPHCGKLTLFLSNFSLSDHKLPISTKISDEQEPYNCMYCGQELFAENADMLMQTIYKDKSPYLTAIQQEMRVAFETVKEIVFIGYSLPKDDLEYLSVFSARRNNTEKLTVKVINYVEGAENKWLSYAEAKREYPHKEIIANFANTFGEDNVLFNFAGAPTALNSENI